jgi:hypothetical protein
VAGGAGGFLVGCLAFGFSAIEHFPEDFFGGGRVADAQLLERFVNSGRCVRLLPLFRERLDGLFDLAEMVLGCDTFRRRSFVIPPARGEKLFHEFVDVSVTPGGSGGVDGGVGSAGGGAVPFLRAQPKSPLKTNPKTASTAAKRTVRIAMIPASL